MMRNIKENGILKAFGVVLLVVLTGCMCFFGAISVVGYQFGWQTDENTTFFDTEYCKQLVENSVTSDWWQTSQTDYHQTKDEDFTDFENLLGENYEIGIQKYDEKNKSYTSIQTLESNTYGLVQTYGISDIDNPEDNNIYLVSDKDIESGNINATYIIEVALKQDLIQGTYLYQEYQLYTSLKPYMNDALNATISCGIAIILILIYEISAAGHVAGKDGITLSTFDKIPFDLLTLIYFCVFAFIASMGITFLSSGSMIYIIPTFSVITGVFVICALLFYFYFISFIVRIKAHTLLKNTVISWGIIKVYKVLVNGFQRVYEIFHNTSSGYKKILFALCGASLLHLFFMMRLFDTYYYINGFLRLILWILFIGEIILTVYLVTLHANLKPVFDASKEISNGNLDYRISSKDIERLQGPFHEHAQHLNEIGEGMSKAIQNELKSEKMKAELITNVSHDIKTPLTSIINYVDLLSKEHTPQQEQEYLEVLKRQSQRLKKLTEDVVEASKASSGTIQLHMETVSMNELLEQALAEYDDKFKEHQLTVVSNIPESIKVHADGRLLWRVLRNILSNAAKYAMDGSRVYIDVKEESGNVITTVKNTSRNQLNISEEELMQRFVRGDASRHTEGSGLGLSIAQSLTELMQGEFQIQIDGDLFKSIVVLKGIHEEEKKTEN